MITARFACNARSPTVRSAEVLSIRNVITLAEGTTFAGSRYRSAGSHHTRLTAVLGVSGVNMSYMSDKRERLAHVRKAVWVFLWMLEEMACHEQGEQ